MRKVVLTTDSGMCPIKKEDSIIIPAQIVSRTGHSYKDNGQEISNAQIVERTKQGEIFKTTCPAMGDYEEGFRKALESGSDVVHISMSSGISAGSVNAANIMASDLNEEYENKVYVVDSFTGATGGSLFYEAAYEMLKEDIDAKELVRRLEEMKKLLHTSFYVPNPEGFLRSGRDKSELHMKERAKVTGAKLANFAGFKFRVDFHPEGDLFLKKVFRSPSKTGMFTMVKDLVNEDTIASYDNNRVAVGSLLKKDVDLEEVKAYLQSFNYFDEVLEQDIGGVIAAYGCDDLCGISLVKKRTTE